MELLVEEEDVAVLRVPLTQHVKVKQGPLLEQVIGLANEFHQQFKGSRELNLVIVVDHQLRIEAGNWSVEDPLEAAGVKVAQLECGLLVVEFFQELLILDVFLIFNGLLHDLCGLNMTSVVLSFLSKILRELAEALQLFKFGVVAGDVLVELGLLRLGNMELQTADAWLLDA